MIEIVLYYGELNPIKFTINYNYQEFFDKKLDYEKYPALKSNQYFPNIRRWSFYMKNAQYPMEQYVNYLQTIIPKLNKLIVYA